MSGLAYYNEIDPYAAQWIRNLIAAGLVMPGDVDERSIVDVRPSDLDGYERCHFFAGIAVWDYALGLAGWPAGRPVWTGSCPCQPFSAAGRKGGVSDERHLWPEFFNLIEQCEPATVLGEQVASKDGLDWLDLVQADLEGAHYDVAAIDLCAAGVGAPHIRQRLWFLADAQRQRLRSEGSGTARSTPRGVPGEDRQRERVRPHVGPGRAGLASVVAHTDGGNTGSEWQQRGRQHGQQSENRFAGVVGDAERARLAVGPVEYQQRGTVRVEGAAIGASGALRGPWSGAQWLWCSDRRWRPVEPGTFPLAHGAPARVGRLRAYGNAINAEAAAAFIGAVIDTLTPTPTPTPGGLAEGER